MAKLTDPAFIQRLETLYLLARKVLGGTLQADRKSTKKGAGITYADHVEYALGDDYRAIDWRVYARMEALMIKLFEVEEDVTLYLLCDCSRSMVSKFGYAKQLAAALGYIGLNNQDKLISYGLSNHLEPILEPSHGRGKILPFLDALERTECQDGDSNFTDCVRRFQARHRKRGLVVVVSDFLFPGGYEEGLKFLTWNRHDVFCLQVQDESDRRCELKGDIELACVETNQRMRVTVTAAMAKKYEEAVANWNAGLKSQCSRLGIGLASTTPDTSFDTVIQQILRRGGLVA